MLHILSKYDMCDKNPVKLMDNYPQQQMVTELRRPTGIESQMLSPWLWIKLSVSNAVSLQVHIYAELWSVGHTGSYFLDVNKP